VNIDVALCLPRDSTTVPLIRDVVAQALRTIGVTASCVDDICLALSEAWTNVIEHAGADDEYEVRLEVDDDRRAISVINTGTGFDADALTGVMSPVESARGRGVAIMRAVMDDVQFTSEPESGTIVHLVKQLDIDEDGALARLRRRSP
jgi:serine/threonine-protein kinase RsbW